MADEKLRAFIASHCVKNDVFSDDRTIVYLIMYRMTDEHLIVLKPNDNRLQQHRT